jgi:hypothetical protein
MRRLTSVLAHVLPAAAVFGLFIAVPVEAQTPVPASAAPTALPPGMAEPVFMPMTVAPTPGPARAQMPAQGQQQATTPPASTAPRAEAPRAPYIAGPNNTPMPAHTNIRLDLTITDTFTGSPVKKNVSLLVLQNNSGMIRTTSTDGWATLNIDAVVAAYTTGMVALRMTFEYTPALGKDVTTANRPPRLNESITVVLQDGKPMIVSQSADPGSDRKVTAEMTATILK